MNKTLFSIIILLFFSFIHLNAQEICDNAIDDDGDGLIDLNDEDCICNSLVPSSLIPNPSFEDMTCCPTANEQLECAVGWIQASQATSDYVHTCGGYLGNTGIPAFAPLPFPDGEGGIGFRDGQQMVGADFKEYVGACLTAPMEIGVTYRLDFFVGFQDNVQGSMDFNIAVFASDNCGNLPFGGNTFAAGCPLNSAGYFQLGEAEVSGSNEWVNVVFEFEADQAYEVIIIGPGCEGNPNFIFDPYFYADRLALAESSEFSTPFESVTGSICENNLVLQMEDNPDNTYQWYQDGIAIIGETNSSILLTALDNTEGTYMVVVTTPDGCFFSQEYDLFIPPYYGQELVNICDGEQYIVGTDTLSDAGFYEIMLVAEDGCDSIVQLILEINMASSSEIADTFCIGYVYSFYDIETTEAGTYQTTIENNSGCDSIITLNLAEIDLGIGMDLDEVVEIDLGETIDVAPNFVDLSLDNFTWYDEAGNIFSNERALNMLRPTQSTSFVLETYNSYGCGTADAISIIVSPNYSIYIPNAFSPDGNGINDYFRFYAPLSLKRVASFSIFDRWGGLVYENLDIVDTNNFLGWDGFVKNEKANQGVYVYLLEAVFIDGTEKIFAGDVNLLR